MQRWDDTFMGVGVNAGTAEGVYGALQEKKFEGETAFEIITRMGHDGWEVFGIVPTVSSGSTTSITIFLRRTRS